MRSLIIGYAFKNFGDDLFFHILANRYPNVHFYLETKIYKQDMLPSNITLLPDRRNLLQKVYDLIFGMLRGYRFRLNQELIDISLDCIIIIGGSIFIEAKSKFPPVLKYLEHNESFFHEKKLYILGCNFGPYNTECFKIATNRLFEKADDVCFRETYSLKQFSPTENLRCESDIVFGLELPDIHRDENLIGISIIDLSMRENLKKYNELYINTIVGFINRVINEGKNVRLFSFCDKENDISACQYIDKIVNKEKLKVIRYNGYVPSFLSQYLECNMIVATRFHAVVLALSAKIPVIPIIYSNKTDNILDDVKFAGPRITIDNVVDLLQMPTASSSNMILEDNVIDECRLSSNKQFFAIDTFFFR